LHQNSVILAIMIDKNTFYFGSCVANKQHKFVLGTKNQVLTLSFGAATTRLQQLQLKRTQKSSNNFQ